MRCSSFCTANNYRLNAIADYFRIQHYTVTSFRNVLHVTKPGVIKDVFFFQHGCFVSWGLTRQQEQTLLAQVKEFSVEPLEKIEKDRFIFRLGKTTNIAIHPRFNTDIITIDENEENIMQIKLAVSYGLAQSIKLESYEESIQRTIHNNNHIPHELAKTGRMSLSRRAISKRIGEVFIERNSVSEYFDIPEFFWRYSNLETYYVMTEKFLDIPKRAKVLNHKLDILHEIFDMLNNQLQHRYSSFLETIIIVLIFLEIILNLFHRV